MLRFVAVGLLIAVPSSAAAQRVVGVAVWDGSDLRCETRSAAACVDGACPGELTCVDFEGDALCVEGDALFCAHDAADGRCPAHSPDPRMTLGAASPILVCMPTSFELCGDDPTRSSYCFYGPYPERAFPVDWAYGDCDEDGIANGDELDEVGVCQQPASVGVVTPGGECASVSACLDDADCATPGTFCARPSPSAHHRFCVDGEAHALCCDESSACPGGACAVAAGDAAGFCEGFEYCAERAFADRAACVYYQGQPVALAAQGDCDEDGVPNGVDSEPCVFDEPGAPDAGALDAGPPPRDSTPAFTGGGGAVCAATPGRTDPGHWLLAALASALLVIRRRV